jgi:hypothetical protein
MAQTNVQAFSGNVGVGTDNPAYSLDVNGTSRLPIIVSTDYSRDISQEYLANFDDLTATDEELCIFEVNPDLDSYSWINGEIEVEIMSRRAQTFMSYLNQKVNIKFNFAWDARSGSGGWRSMSCFVDHTRYIESGGGQNLQYPVTVFYKYKGTRDPTDIQPKLQVYIKYSGTNFFGYFSVKGHYNSSDFNSFNPTFPSTVFTTDGNTTDTQATVYMANDFNTGNVGIGTTNPARNLHVFHPTYGVHRSIYWTEKPGDPATQSPIQMGYLGSSDPSYGSGALGLFQNTSEGQSENEAIRIQANGDSWFNGGNVGLGLTNPAAKLHLLGVGTGTGRKLRFETLNNGNPNYTVSGTEIGGIEFGADDYGWSTQHMSSEIVGIHDTPNYSGARGILVFKTSTSQGSNPTEKMRINHDGNVGIGGITSPTAKLEVYNSATAADSGGLVADFTGPWIRIGDARTARTFSSGTGIKFHDTNVVNFSIGIKDGVFKMGQTSSDGSRLFPGASTDRENSFCLTSDRLLGLGLTNPTSRIHMYKSDFTKPTNGTEFGNDSSLGVGFRSRIHSGGQAPAPYWYNSLAIDNVKMWFNPKSYQFVGNSQAGSHGVFNIGTGFINNSQVNTPNVTITTNDRVGINREQPSYTLDINGSIRYTGTPGSNSDSRIKRNIVDVNDASALETIRLIKPKRYDYIDTKSKDTEDTVWGFIAQEVREVLPYATDVISDFIPNIMTWSNVVDSNVIMIDTTELLSNTGNLLLKDVFDQSHYATIAEVIDAHSLKVEEDLSGFTGSRDTSGDGITETQTITVTVEEYNALEDTGDYEPVIGSYTRTTIDDSNVSQTTTLTVEEYNALEDTTGYEPVISSYMKTYITTPGSEIFVYGQEVDDFHVLKKDAIWTVATAALQEVDRQQRSDKIRITELETQITSVLSRLDALEA